MISYSIKNGINGVPNIPGDKSISHRSIIIPSISNGICEIDNILKSEDVLHTINAFKKLGVKIEEISGKLIIYGNGLESLKKPTDEIYLGNSGTSARLLTGLLSSQKFDSILKGDDSLSKRPMERIAQPLNNMNAKIHTSNGTLPILIKGNKLKATKIDLKIPSAQIKSGILLASLNTEGETCIIENKVTRDHTEIMLDAFGANIDIRNTNIIKFDKTEFNLSKFTTKSTVFPKIQETNSIKLLECLNSFINKKEGFFERLFVCDNTSVNSVFQEMYKRLILPLYIIISGFIASCLVMKTRSQSDSLKFKSIIFILGFIFIIFSEGSINILSFDNLNKSLVALLPFIISIFGYLVFISSKKLKFL